MNQENLINPKFMFPLEETARMFEQFLTFQGESLFKTIDKNGIIIFDANNILKNEEIIRLRQLWREYYTNRGPWFENRTLMQEKSVLFAKWHKEQCDCLPKGAMVERKFRM